MYDEKVQISKEITSIYISNDTEENFKAVFSQSILLDSNSIGKPNKNEKIIPIYGYVVDYVGKVKVSDNKIDVKKNVVYPMTFELQYNENDTQKLSYMLSKYLKVVKKNSINEVCFDGNIIESSSVVNISYDDLSPDIKELIDMGFYTQEEVALKVAVGNKTREKHFQIVKPTINVTNDGEDKKSITNNEPDKYSADDLCFYEQALLEAGVNTEKEQEVQTNTEPAESTETKADDNEVIATKQDTEDLLDLFNM